MSRFSGALAVAAAGVATLALGSVRVGQDAGLSRRGQHGPVYATVTDARGVLIPNLGMSDVQIDDDGRRQAITFFKNDIQPMTIAVLLDSSPSLSDVAQRLQKAVTEFVGHLRPDDRACLGIFSHVVTLNPALTGDHDVLLRRLGDERRFRGHGAVGRHRGARRRLAENGRRVVLT